MEIGTRLNKERLRYVNHKYSPGFLASTSWGKSNNIETFSINAKSEKLDIHLVLDREEAERLVEALTGYLTKNALTYGTHQ